MPRAKPTLEFRKPSLTEGWLGELCRIIRLGYEQLVGIVNGRISFGDGTNSDNIDGVWADVTTPFAPDTNFSVTHNLGRLPAGYFVARREIATEIYDGTDAWTETTISLRSTIGEVPLVLFIF